MALQTTLSEKKLNVCGNSALNGMRWKVYIERMWTFRTECSFNVESPHSFYVDFPTHVV